MGPACGSSLPLLPVSRLAELYSYLCFPAILNFIIALSLSLSLSLTHSPSSEQHEMNPRHGPEALEAIAHSSSSPPPSKKKPTKSYPRLSVCSLSSPALPQPSQPRSNVTMFSSGFELYSQNRVAAEQRRVDNDSFALTRSRNHSGYCENANSASGSRRHSPMPAEKKNSALHATEQHKADKKDDKKGSKSPMKNK